MVTKINKMKITISLALILLLSLNLASAVTVRSVSSTPFSPGKEGTVSIELKNTLSDDALDVSLSLDLSNVPFTPVGSSEESVDEIQEDDNENFAFALKASNNIVPGDYKIPYTLSYTIGDEQKKVNGTIGITVTASADLVFTLTLDNPVINQQGKINLKIVNKGFGDAKFVSVIVISDGYTLLSEDQVYIGSIDSDDFETASFDAIFNSKNALFTALIDYTDFNNNKMSKTISLPMNVYTSDEAVKLGIIKKNNTGLYIGLIVLLIVAWFVYRSIRKRMRRAKRIDSERK